MNKCITKGRFTADPVLRYTDSGTPVISFTLAVDRKYKDADGNKMTDFFDFVAWKNTAEFIAGTFSKGRAILVESTPQVREWLNKEGERRRNVEFIVDSVEFCDSPCRSETSTIEQEETMPF